MGKDIRKPRVEFKYDLKLDAENLVRSAKKQRVSFVSKIKKLPQDQIVYKELQSCETDEKAKKVAESKLERVSDQIKQKVNAAKEKLEPEWKKRESEYFLRLEKLTQRPIYADRFTAYFVTDVFCSFNPQAKWFMLSWRFILESQIVSICHELMHMQFLTYYKDYCRKHGLTDEELGHFKEALTVLLNEEFADLLPLPDKGYLVHKKLRSQLTRLWRQKKDFKVFLPKAIEIMKMRKQQIQRARAGRFHTVHFCDNFCDNPCLSKKDAVAHL